MNRREHSLQAGQAGLTHLVVGLLALPLSVLPFVAYGTMTPEGRLVRDRIMVKVAPPLEETWNRTSESEE